MHARTLRCSLFIGVIFLATIACNALTRFTRPINQAKATVQSIETEAGLIKTQGSKIIGTIGAAVTEVMPLVGTGEAIATREGPGIIATAEALATQHPGILETAQAFATQGFFSGQAPPDIPLVPKDKIGSFFATQDLVSFTTTLDYNTVLNFYKNEMHANEWTFVPEGYQIGNSSMLMYSKPSRVATVVISVNPVANNTVVIITIQPK